MLSLGIDPGRQGCYSVLDVESKSLIAYGPLPYDGKTPQPCKLQDILNSVGRVELVTMEYVTSFGMGAGSAFQFGRGVGHWEALAQLLKPSFFYQPTPQVWQKDIHGRPIGKLKQMNTDWVKERYPDIHWPTRKPLREGLADSIAINIHGIRRFHAS